VAFGLFYYWGGIKLLGWPAAVQLPSMRALPAENLDEPP